MTKIIRSSFHAPCGDYRSHGVKASGKPMARCTSRASMTLVSSDELPAVGHGVSGFWWEAVDEQSRAVPRFHFHTGPHGVGLAAT